MAKMSRSARKGMLGELAVARIFVEQGCSVNSLTAMDHGLDIHVQLPSGLKPPDPASDYWKLSGRAAHIQVKSTSGTAITGISVETAQAWNLGVQTGGPTLLVAVTMDDENQETGFRFFSPIFIDRRAALAEEKGCSEFSISLHAGEAVEPLDLFDKVVYWLTKGPFLLSHAFPRPWGATAGQVWAASRDMVMSLTLTLESHFHEPDYVREMYPYVETIDNLMQRFLSGANIDSFILDQSDLNSKEDRRSAIHIETHARVHESSTQDEWSEHVGQLAAVTLANNKRDALQDIGDICHEYGYAVRNILTPGYFEQNVASHPGASG